MQQENLYISKHLSYLSQLDNQSIENLIHQVLDLDQDEQQLLDRMRKQSGSTYCRQQVIIKEIQIRCHDCGISENNIFCQPCFDENLHQDHQIQLLRDEFSGFCDCGDPNSIRAEGFCKSHSLKSIQMQSTNEEKQLLGKLKVLLEISSYNSIRLLEQRSMMPIIEADENVIQNSQYLKQIFQSEQNAYNAYQKMNAIVIYLTESNPQLIELVCQVFTSEVPIALQFIEQFQHNHLPIFDIGRVIETKSFQNCKCSVWKNLLRYIIFLGQQELYIEEYLPHLLIDPYSEVITKIFVEMIPFQLQIFTKTKFQLNQINEEFSLYVPVFYQEGYDNYLESQEIMGKDCTQKFTKEVQLSSQIFHICYQFQQRFIQYFQFHKGQIEYIGWFIQQGVLTSTRFTNILDSLRFQLFGQLRKSQFQYCLNEFFQNDLIDSYAFMTIINLIPCKPYQKHQDPELEYEDKHILKLIKNQCHIILLFEQFFQGLIQICKDNVQKLQITRIMLQYLMKKMIQLYPINYENQFNLGKLQFLIAQFVSADHIMIILLSFYYQLKQIKKRDQLIQILLEDCQISNHQLQQLFKNLAQRSIQNLALISNTQYYTNYCRKETIYVLNNKSEFSQESLDRSMIQMYLFLYGEKAIVDAYNYVEYINKTFKTNYDRDRFLNFALSSDFDMYQTCSHYFIDDLPQDFKKALRKIIKSLFYSQNYFSFYQILDNFNQMGNNQLNMLNENNLLDILELEPHSGQLRLKKEFQPPLFEPLYFNNQAIFKQIQDKLNEDNNQEVILFGNSIEYDFSCTEEGLKTLSSIRYHIIDQLLKGSNIMATIILGQLYSQSDDNIKVNIIKQNKYLIYLFIIASKYLKLPEQNQHILQNLFEVIQQLTIKNTIIDILKQKIVGNQLIVEFKKPIQSKKDQKLLKMKQKFQQKQQQFENQICKDANIIPNELDPNIICSFCVQQIDTKLDEVYQVSLFQLNNNLIHYSAFTDFQYLQYLKQYSQSISELTQSGCTHIFHQQCIKKLKIIEIQEEQFYQCIICKSLGNKIFPVSNFKSIHEDIEYFTLIAKTDMLAYYYQTYNLNGKLDIKSVNAEIILQIYLQYIRQMVGNTNFYDNSDNIQRFQKFTLLIKQSMDEQIQNQYLIIINKHPQSVIFQIFKQMLHHSFDLETQQFSQEILSILGHFGLLDQQNQVIFENLFKYEPGLQKFKTLKNIIEQKVEQYTNLRDLQKRVIQKCTVCKGFTQYICLGCDQKVCNEFEVILDYKKSCCYLHSIKCHNGNMIILDAQTGVGYVAYQSEIVLYQKQLYKSILGQTFQGDFKNSIKYLVDPIAFQEFYNIQIHNKQLTYIIKNKK